MRTYLVSIDPGGDTGWASWDAEGNVLKTGTCHDKEEVYVMLMENRPEVVICEEWRNYPGSPAPKWGKQDTARVIGAIEMFTSVTGAKLHMQPASILGVGYGWSGTNRNVPKSQSHLLDAYCHGFYWFVRQGILTPTGGRK